MMPSSSEITPVHKPLHEEKAYSSDEADEDSHSAYFTINIETSDSQTGLQLASAPISCPPWAGSVDTFDNSKYILDITSCSESSVGVDSSSGLSSTPTADSFSLSASTNGYSLAGYVPIESTSTSSASTPATIRRPIRRSASDSNFGARVGVSLAERGPTHIHVDEPYLVRSLRLSGGRSKNSFVASLDALKESEWLEGGYTSREVDAFQVRNSSCFLDLSLLREQHDYSHTQQVALQPQQIFYTTPRPPTTSWGSLFNRLPQGGRSLLCSHCKQMSPVLRNVPRRFSYTELGAATSNFSESNFLAEGGFGFVYRGELNGQAIAVKQHKLASSQGDKEFRSEVELLSCAQHRNLVMLLGCCDENGQRMLVYEFVCNKSLDWHLSPTKNPKGLPWSARLKVAIGAARALRYLHEESRVGCIVHRDMRPNNILLTHDYEPMVGDFGLARSHPEGQEAIETRVIGTFGYLAPEYAESGQVSWRADVYAFGVVLLELITGRKAIDLLRPPGQQSLTEWARPKLLKFETLMDVVDSRLDFPLAEMRAMMQAAFRCISKDPAVRPRMSQVLHILEGEGRSTEELSRPSMDVESVASSKVYDSQLPTSTTQLPLTASQRTPVQKLHSGSSGSSSSSSSILRRARLNYNDML